MTDLIRQQVFFLLQKHRILPQKRLGQNFLVVDRGVEEIFSKAQLAREDLILEIGAGLGQLTRLIAPQVRWVIALEFDNKLYNLLRKELIGQENITLIETDASRCKYEEIINYFPKEGGKIKIIGNLPYNAAVPILVHLESIRSHISLMIVTLQKELADRLCAHPAEKAYGDLSVRMQYYYQLEPLLSLPPEAFYPRPKVRSQILALYPLDHPPVLVKDENLFFRLVRAAFSQRRKTILNSLRAHPELGIPHDQWPFLLEKAGISPQRRGETLSLGEFARLSHLVFGL